MPKSNQTFPRLKQSELLVHGRRDLSVSRTKHYAAGTAAGYAYFKASVCV